MDAPEIYLSADEIASRIPDGALIGVPKGIGDSSIAALMVVLMFIIPDGRGQKLLDWKSASSIPWGILLLFGGGIALAPGFKSSGLSALLANQLIGVTLPSSSGIVGSC